MEELEDEYRSDTSYGRARKMQLDEFSKRVNKSSRDVEIAFLEEMSRYGHIYD